MSFQVPSVAPQDIAELSAAQPRTQAGTPAGPAAPAEAHGAASEAVAVDATPSRPPAEVLAQMEAASRRYDELRAQKRELHFTHDDQRNRVVVEVRDLEGNVLRTIPPSKALDIIAGGPLD
jgi:hypothetical protein